MIVSTVHMNLDKLSAIESNESGTHTISYGNEAAFFEDFNRRLRFGWTLLSSSANSFTLSRQLPERGALVFKDG